LPERAFVIAVDGPAASGKGTLARALAQALGLRHLDSGVLYRATALRLLDAGGTAADTTAAVVAARGIADADLRDPRLRDAAVAQAASAVAAIPEVRAALLERQRAFAVAPPGAVIDGRDIGTVVLPDADLKLFVTADEETRVRRRHAELTANGASVTLDEVRGELRQRDRRDAGRAIAPLRQAADAVLIDTTDLDPAAMLAAAMAIAAARRGAPGSSCDSGAGGL
jgi:cytidylate kinase